MPTLPTNLRRLAVIPSFFRDFATNKTLDHGAGPSITFTRTGTATYFDSSGNLTTASANTPRFDHDPSTLASRGLLIEEGRTNSLRNSQAGGSTNGVIGSGGAMPTNWSGQTTVNGVTQQIFGTGNENGFSYIDINFSGTPTATSSTTVSFESSTQIVASQNQTWTSSAYFKLVDGSTTNTTPRLGVSGRTSGGSQITADTTFVNLSLSSTLLTKQEISRTMSDSTVARVLSFFNLVYTNGLQIGGSSNGLTFRIAAPQLEQGSFATSYIPTTSAAVTRGADVAQVLSANIGTTLNSNEGTLFYEGSRYVVPASNYGADWIILKSNSNNSFVAIQNGTAVPSQQRIQVLDSAGIQQAICVAAVGGVANTIYKAAGVYKNDDFIFYQNGVGTTPDTSGSGWSSLNQIGIGSNTSISFLNGHIRKVAYYPKRLNNSTLASLTA